jgi:hypothetical protein
MRTTGRVLSLAALIITVAALPALAQGKRPAELSQLDFFAGTWQCTGNVFDSPVSKAKPTVSTVKAESTLDKRWLKIDFAESKTAQNANPLNGTVLWGWDSAGKQFVAMYADDEGTWGTQTSKGWQTNKMVFRGPGSGGGKTAEIRDTFLRTTTDEIVHTSEVKLESGNWRRYMEERCAKGGAPAATATPKR